MDEQELISRIQSLYPDATIDLAGENCSFEVYVIDETFAGMKTLDRQRSILDLFSTEITQGKLHALTVKARTSEEMAQATANSGLIQLG